MDLHCARALDRSEAGNLKKAPSCSAPAETAQDPCEPLKDPANRAEPVLLHLPHHRTTCGQCWHVSGNRRRNLAAKSALTQALDAKSSPISAHDKLTKHVDAALATANAPQDTTRRQCSNDLGLRARARPQGGYEPQNCHRPGATLREAPMLQDTPLPPSQTGNCALLARPKPAGHRSTRCHRCHASGSRRPRPAAKNCAGSRPETRDVRGVNKCCSGYRRCGGHAWATPRTAAAPQVRGAGGRRRKRAGSAHTCLIPRLEAPRRRRVNAWRFVSQPAAKPRRGPGAASAATHHDAVGVVALPK
eukprot:scaffold14233_cov148-Isochrysis_galbana.AAC.4